jgi:PAS domain S-box-containing protein
MKQNFKRQTLGLFFIVSLVPALTVGAVWYTFTQLQNPGDTFLSLSSWIVPTAILGILPAIILSVLFAELLSRPVRDIHRATQELAKGNYSYRIGEHSGSEFAEIAQGMDLVAGKLQMKMSETETELTLIEGERNKLRGVLNSMTDGVFAVDQVGRIILFNKAACELTGRSVESVAGQLAEKVMPFRTGGELVMTRWLAETSGAEHRLGQWKNLELYRADGTSLYVDVQAIGLDSDPNGIRALVTFHDLTKGHQLEQMQVDFVALAAHELRTPVTEIRGYLDIVQHEKLGLAPEGMDLVNRSVTSALQLAGIINNILNVAKIEHGELNYQPERGDWGVFVKTMATRLGEQARQQKRSLTVHIPARLPQMLFDPVGMQEVISNLVQNAIIHTGKNGKISITVTRHDREVETLVTDNGAGIPAEALSRLFTKFYRVTGPNTSRGTGLGLYISKAIVEAHGGHIYVESVEGKGSTFGFRLPLPTVGAKRHTSTNITRGIHGWIKDHSVR